LLRALAGDPAAFPTMTPWYEKARLALKAKGIRYIDLAAVLGCTEGAVGHYLRGRREPTVETLRTIAEQAGLSLSEMVGDDPRFIGDADEKQLIDIYRKLGDEKRRNLLALIKALKD
jgi:transcriptional regulator with XRE-family HTH domain